MDSKNLREVAALALRLGFTAFGGPAVHIAMLEESIVQKRGWMSRKTFVDYLGATNLIPGPNSTEMVMHAGYQRAGWGGLVLAGICFIAPAAFLSVLAAWAYIHYGALPEIKAVFFGLKPAVLIIIARAVVHLGKTTWRSPLLIAIAIFVFAGALVGIHEIVLLFAAGFIGAAIATRPKILPGVFPVLLGQVAIIPGWGGLFWIFFKIGALLYGSGYVLYAFLDAELVTPGYLTSAQLFDAIAVGQFTPGPLLSTASFLGYLLGGWPGAIIATVAIFLPAFIYVAAIGPYVSRLRNSRFLAAFLDAVNAAAVAMIAAVCISLGKEALADWFSASIAVIAFLLVIFVKNINSIWILLCGIFLGMINFLIL